MGGGVSRAGLTKNRREQLEQSPLLKKTSLLNRSDKTVPGVILIAGLDYAGKTTFLEALQMTAEGLEFHDEVLPQPGPTSERKSYFCRYEGQVFEVIDSPGKQRERILWLQNPERVIGLIFIIDPTDALRLPLAFAELAKLARAPGLAGAPALVAFSKRDLLPPGGAAGGAAAGQGPAAAAAAAGPPPLEERAWAALGRPSRCPGGSAGGRGEAAAAAAAHVVAYSAAPGAAAGPAGGEAGAAATAAGAAARLWAEVLRRQQGGRAAAVG